MSTDPRPVTLPPAMPPLRLTWDRGTLALGDLPPGLDPATLPGVRHDPRTNGWRAPANRYSDLLCALRQSRVPVRDLVPASGPAPSPWRTIDLRPYQEEALAAWRRAGRCGVVVLPTGSGKTRLALRAMAECGVRSLCLVPTRVLLEQWLAAIAAVHPGRVGQVGDGVYQVLPVTVATYESAWRRMPEIGNRFELLIVDEAHHFGARGRDETLELAIAPWRLGLTATPPEDEAAAAASAQLLGPLVYELCASDLAGSWLAPLQLVVVPVELEPDERAAYARAIATFRRFREEFRATAPQAGWDDFCRAAARTTEGRAALVAWRRVQRLLAFPREKRRLVRDLLARHRGSRVLVFTADNETAYAIAREHLVMPLTCDIGRREREQAIAAFRKGALRTLVSARVLDEGFDVPDADVGVVVGGSGSARAHRQRIGRLLRPGPGKLALVHELIVRGTVEEARGLRRRHGMTRGASVGGARECDANEARERAEREAGWWRQR